MSPEEAEEVPPHPRRLMEVLGSVAQGWDDSLYDWGDDADEVIESSCDLESPESCESCQ